MEYIEMTQDELISECQERLKEARIIDYKWIYNYFKDHDKFPLVTDEHIVPRGEHGEGSTMGHHIY